MSISSIFKELPDLKFSRTEEREIRTNLMRIFFPITGQDTTKSENTAILLMLSIHQDVQDKVS